ncbi:MAG: [protein-PII] uridylyltransferase [Hyphomonas sp.]
MDKNSAPSTADPELVATTISAKRRPGKWRIGNIIDGRALRVKLTTAALDNANDPQAARKIAMDVLHQSLFRGRMIAQERLQQGADGLDTARLLAAVQDEVVSALYDFTVTHVHRARNPTEAERLSVMATGGYGRSVMAPSSDIDLLFLRAYKVSPHTESVVEYMMYALWDMGLKVGNAFRSPQECLKLASEDVTIKTSLLDARFICGDKALADEMVAEFHSQIVKGKDAMFIADKLEERDNRHVRQGDARYVVEPNVKEGKGGLRDLQTLYWIVKHIHGGVTLEDAMRLAPFTRAEYGKFTRAARFLWTVRCHLHYVTGRPEERLSFDLQPEIASRMGYQDRGQRLGVERFMKHYFLVARDVGNLTRILAAKLEADEQKKPEGFRRFFPQKQGQRLADEGFVVETNRVNIVDESVMIDDPVNMVRLFTIAKREEIDVHPDALTALTRNLRLFNDNVRRTPAAREQILSALLDGDTPGQVLRSMNEAGILGRAIPEFGGIVAQTQFNMYHSYTVDEHTVRAVGHVSDLEHGRDKSAPKAHEVFGRIDNRRALYLAMLLHDTGKGRGDQQVQGMRTSRRACERLGIPAAEVALVAWLVGNHLEMSETAQKRDIADPRTVVKFARLVGSLERLRLLYILTIADIKAVGPGVWNTWKGQLLHDLYINTAAALRGGRGDEETVQAQLESRAMSQRDSLKAIVTNVPPIMLEMETAYWVGFSLEDLQWQAEELAAGDGSRVAMRELGGSRAMALLVSGKDRPKLFADLAGALVRLGANIASAQVFTSKSGDIIDNFILQDARGRPYGAGDEHRQKALVSAIESVLAGEPALGDVKRRDGRREAAFIVQPQAQIRDDVSAEFTVLDVAGRDRPGLLQDVADILAQMQISVHSAHVGSYGERVFDAFYVTTMEGEKLTDYEQKTTLRNKLLAVLDREEPDAPKTPARKLKRSRAVDSF